MNKEQLRLRFQPTCVKVRECGDENREGDEKKVIEGCAIVFDQETTIYDGGSYKECEVIKPSCLADDFLKEQDIKLNLLHKRSQSFGRYNKGEGTLKLDLREDGLYFSIEVPDCDLGKRALALIENGTYSGCSFEFYPSEYNIVDRSHDNITEYLIEHTKFKSVTALTIAMDPAYEATSVEARENCLVTDKSCDISHGTEQMENEAEENREADEEAKRIAEEKAALRQRQAEIRDRELELIRLGQ